MIDDIDAMKCLRFRKWFWHRTVRQKKNESAPCYHRPPKFYFFFHFFCCLGSRRCEGHKPRGNPIAKRCTLCYPLLICLSSLLWLECALVCHCEGHKPRGNPGV